MPDLSLVTVVAIVAIVAIAATWQPERTVMALGVFLFVQSAIVRVDLIPEAMRSTVGRLDEVVVVALAVRFAVAGAVTRQFAWPGALWAALAFVGVGLLSMTVNAVPLVEGSVGLFLALKGALWLFVAAQLRYDRLVVMRYTAVVAALFMAAIGVAVVQFAGVSLPWDPLVRRSGELAATSIWNQHTVFGSALALSGGVAVMLRFVSQTGAHMAWCWRVRRPSGWSSRPLGASSCPFRSPSQHSCLSSRTARGRNACEMPGHSSPRDGLW